MEELKRVERDEGCLCDLNPLSIIWISPPLSCWRREWVVRKGDCRWIRDPAKTNESCVGRKKGKKKHQDQQRLFWSERVKHTG